MITYEIQDAYHYALAAAGRDSSFEGQVETGVRTKMSFLRAAVRLARKNNVPGALTVDARRLDSAPSLVAFIETATSDAGIDPWTGGRIACDKTERG